jgi:hypothetical protein
VKVLRRILIYDQARPRRDCVTPAPYRDRRGDEWADIIDMLTVHPEARCRVTRILGEIETND